MKCPYCGNEMVKGTTEATNIGLATDALTMVLWYSEEEAQKSAWRRKELEFKVKGEGYYCESCKKTLGIFDQRK